MTCRCHKVRTFELRCPLYSPLRTATACAQTKSKLAKGRSGLSDYSDDEDVENRRPAHNQPTSRQHNNGVKQHSNKPAGGGNGRNRKKVEDEEELEPDEPPRSKHQPEPRSNGDQGGKRIRSPNDSEGRTAAAKKTKQAEQQPLMSNNGRAHGQRKSLEELAAEQQQAEAAKAPKSKPRSKQAKKGETEEHTTNHAPTAYPLQCS